MIWKENSFLEKLSVRCGVIWSCLVIVNSRPKNTALFTDELSVHDQAYSVSLNEIHKIRNRSAFNCGIGNELRLASRQKIRIMLVAVSSPKNGYRHSFIGRWMIPEDHDTIGAWTSSASNTIVAKSITTIVSLWRLMTQQGHWWKQTTGKPSIQQSALGEKDRSIIPACDREQGLNSHKY